MSKKKNQTKTSEGHPEPSSPQEPKIKIEASSFVIEMATLMYLGSASRNLSFEELSAEDQKEWADVASIALISLDKMNKMVVTKVEQVDLEDRAQKNMDKLEEIVRAFIKGLKTTKPELFPVKELVLRIWNGRAA